MNSANTTNKTVDERIIREFKNWVGFASSDCTADSYAATVATYCAGRSLEEVSQKEFYVNLRESLSARSARLGTISRHTFAWKKFVQFLNEEHGVPIFDLSRIRCKHAPATNPVYLEREEIAAIRQLPIRSEIDLRNRTLFEFLLDTGCRISEALMVDFGKIDVRNREVAVEGKGNKRRVVFLSASIPWIERYQAQGHPFFASQYNTRLQRQNGTVAIRELGKAAGLAKTITPHTLRHTFVTYLIWAGVDPRTVQMMAGHDDIDTTLRYYSAVTHDRMRQSHKLLVRVLSSSRSELQVVSASNP